MLRTQFVFCCAAAARGACLHLRFVCASERTYQTPLPAPHRAPSQSNIQTERLASLDLLSFNRAENAVAVFAIGAEEGAQGRERDA